MGNPTWDETTPTWDETSPEGEAPAKPGAKQAFEAGQSNASMYPDMPGGGEGKQVYANPVSAGGAIAASALRGASSLPFVGNTAEKAITSVTGTSPEQYQQFEQAAQEQHPGLSAGGELGGIALGGKALGMAGEGVMASAKAAGAGLKAIASSTAGGVLRAGAKAAGWLHAPWAYKAASMLEDAAALANPAVLRKNIQMTERVLGSVGSDMAKSYSQLSKELPVDSLETAANLKNMIRGAIIEDSKAANVIRDEQYYKALDKGLNEAFSPFKGNAKLSPNQIWGRAKGLAEKARTFETSTLPSDVSARGIMNDIQFKMREQLAAHAEQHAMQTGDSTLREALSTQNENYGKISEGLREMTKKFRPVLKAEAVQVATDRVAQVLSFGKKLPSKHYETLVRAVRRGGLPAAVNMHSHLMNDSEAYRNAVGAADQESSNGPAQ